MACEDLEGMQVKMTNKFGCPLTKTRELLQISKQLQLNVVGVRYVSTICGLMQMILCMECIVDL